MQTLYQDNLRHIANARDIVLRRNPPEIRVTSGQKPCTKIIYNVLKTSVGLFSMSSKNDSFLTAPNVENEC